MRSQVENNVPESSRARRSKTRKSKPNSVFEPNESGNELCGANGIPQWEQPNMVDWKDAPPLAQNRLPPRHSSPKPMPLPRPPRRLKSSPDRNNRSPTKTPRYQSFENRVLSINMERMESVGDLTVDERHQPFQSKDARDNSLQASFALLDLVQEEDCAAKSNSTPSTRTKSRRHKTTEKMKGGGRNRARNHTIDSRSVEGPKDPLTLSVLYSSWKDGSHAGNLDAEGDSVADFASLVSDMSSIGCLDDESSCGSYMSIADDNDQLLGMQEEEMLALALERSVADFSSSDHSGTTYSAKGSACRSNGSRTMESACRSNGSRICPGGRKPLERKATKTHRDVGLGGAGCHLTIIGDQLRDAGRPSNLRGGPMLKGFESLSDEEEEDILPGDSFAWKRDAATKRWYKKPVSSRVVHAKSEEELMLEKVSELSLKDCLASSLHELQVVTLCRPLKDNKA